MWVVSLLSCLSRLAPSVTRLCILGRFVRWTKKKERLLVVCFFGGCHATLWMEHCVTSQKTAVKETRLSLWMCQTLLAHHKWCINQGHLNTSVVYSVLISTMDITYPWVIKIKITHSQFTMSCSISWKQLLWNLNINLPCKFIGKKESVYIWREFKGLVWVPNMAAVSLC